MQPTSSASACQTKAHRNARWAAASVIRNIHQADHEKVLHALLLTLAEFLGDDFSPEAARARESVYGKIAETMIGA